MVVRAKGKPKPGTAARVALAKNLGRTRALQRIFDADSLRPRTGESEGRKRGRGTSSAEERELLRAVVVFAIGALDAYLSDVAGEVLVAQLAKARLPNPEARALLRQVMKEIDTLPIELALTTDAKERMTLARESIADHLANRVSNHGAKGIAATLGRLGATVDWGAIDASAYPTLTASAKATGAAAVLDHWTNLRHQIVHQGRAVRVAAEQARQLTDFIECVADYVDTRALAAVK